MQDFINSIFQAIQLPIDIFIPDVQISDVALTIDTPADANLKTTYSGSGSVRWALEILGQKIDTLARIQLSYNSQAKPSPYTGKVSATTTFDLFGVGATFTLEYEIVNQGGTNQGSKIIRLIWEGLSLEYVQGTQQTELIFTADSTWNLGRLIQVLVRFIAPASAKELPTPWNLLNNVSLAGMKVKFNFTTKAVSVSWPIGLKLFFGEISTLEVIKTPGQQVNVTLTGKFLFNNSDQVKWDALTQDPPVVPGGGDSAFDLRLLALGQHVTVPDLAAISSVGEAVNQLTGFKQPLPTSRVVPVLPAPPKNSVFLTAGGDPPAPRFSRDSNWLIGTHFYAVSGMLDLKAIFNDPVLYGLRIGLAGPKAKIFAGLEFEILYKKVTDTIGMYRVMLKLPDAMRYLQFGNVTIILPVVTVEVYTNGNFKVDFGFPRNLDFSLSFTVQVFPFTGSGGFYFGWLNGATSTQTPANPSCGTFNPVIEFGLGMQVGLGKSVNVAILKAEISVTIFGIIEGVVGTWRPYAGDSEHALSVPGSDGRRRLLARSGQELVSATGESADVATSYYYKVTGTLGLIGRIVGVVDFAIIKAEVSLTVYAYLQGTFEAYRKTVILLEAGVRVSVKLSINCGLFKITINLSFSARIREQFTIGSDHLQDAPWYCGGNTQVALPVAATLRLRRPPEIMLRALGTGPNFAPLLTPSYGQLPLDVFFVPQLSISGEGVGKGDQVAVYSANLFVSNESRTQDQQQYESFRRLVRDTYLWIASSFSGETVKGTPEEELDKVATVVQMEAAREYLGANSDGRAITYPAIAAFLANLFRLEIKLPPAVVPPNPGPSSTAFPIPPELTLLAEYKGAKVASRDFADWVMADEKYLSDVQEAINKLLANLLDELERQHDPGTSLRMMLRSASVDTRSIADFVFCDYFVMLARGLVQDALDAFDNYSYKLQGGDSIASIREAFNNLGDSNQNHLTDEQIAWINRDHALAGGVPLTVNGVPYRIQDKDTLGGIAEQHGLDAGTIAQDNATVEMMLIPGRPITINNQTHPVPNRGTIELTAAEFGMQPAEFGNSIAAMKELLSPLTVIILNGLKHTTPQEGTADTIASLAQLYGIEVPVLTPSIATVGGLFDDKADAYLLLPGLSALTNREIWNDIELSSGVEHLSGMGGRYLLNGLRLPTAGLIFKDPAHPCKSGATCGLENLTGQQFALPSLEGYDPANPLSIVLANPKALSWVVFVNQPPGDSSTLKFLVPAEGASQVNDLVAYARKTGLQAPIEPPAAEDLALVRGREYTFKNNIILQTAAVLPLPNEGSVSTPRPRIWNFSAGLQTELARPVALAPLFRIEIGTTNADGGRIIPRAAQSYGFATLINVAIKRVTATAAVGQPVSPTTYELVGADEVGVNQLERLLHAISPTDTSIINGIYVIYPPNQSSDRAQGLQYDGEEIYTTFLVRGNLSTETNPPTGQVNQRSLRALTGPPRGLLNSDYEFISMLWEGSIVRSGGYYFKYVLPDGNGLPDSLFNEDNLANISVLVVYSRIEGIGGDQGGVLKDFMNAAVVADPIDDSNDVVYVASCPRAASVEITAETTLAGVADLYHAGVIDIAWQNRTKPLSTTTEIKVVDIVHQVQRGQTLAQIASLYGTTETAIKALNPNVDFNNLQPGTGLHIPDLVTHPAAVTPGLTFPEIAHYYSSTFGALAWANRDTTKLYETVPANTLTFDDMLNDKQAVMPPGNVGLVITRKNPGESELPPVYLEQQYNLLGYDLIANTDFLGSEDALPLPAGPANDEDEQTLAAPKRQAPRLAASEEPWVYRFNIPAARYARNNPVPESSTETPYPARNMNPYAGVGGFVQLFLDWRDMMGNHTWSPFDDASPSNPYPLNRPPSRVGANDDVIGLAQWPSTQFDHFFARRTDQTGGELRIEWRFDPSRYSDPGLDGELWRRNAEADRQVFANLYYQLLQTARDGKLATGISTLCSLAPANAVEITAEERSAVTGYVLAAWRYVVKVLENNGTLPPPSDLPSPLSLVRSITATSSTIVEISVVVRMERITSTVLSDFRDESASRVSDTAISPRLTQPDPTAGYTLDWYTASFTEAFDAPGYSLRLASGTPRSDLGMQSGRDTLWSVRLGKQQSEAYWYRIEEPAIFFALAPLSTQLLNRPDVTLYSFNPDTGLSPQPDQTETFTGIDLDVWARNALGGIDQLLEPQYAVPAFLVDYKGGTAYLQTVLDAKFKLASAIVTGMTNILTSPALDPVQNADNFEAAREKLRQQLLIKLANAYAIDAVVQYGMQITAPSQDPIPPRLYGSPADPSQAETPKDYTVSTFKIPLRENNPLLTFTFAARQTSRQSSFALPFSYAPTHIEHEISAVPEIQGFEASSWLQFVNSPAPILSTGGDPVINVNIPIPLRAYPTPPTLLQQAFLAAASSSDPSTTLEKAKEWTFRFLYSQAHAAQDRIDAVVRLNVPQTQFKAALTETEPDLFVMLARINHVLTQIQSVWAQDLLAVNVDTPTDSPQFVRAQNAMAAFAKLVTDLDVKWKAWVKNASELNTLFATGLDQQLPFSILEDAATIEYQQSEQQLSEKVLRVTIAYPSGLLPGLEFPPAVVFDGYTAVEVTPDQAKVVDAGRGNAHEDVRTSLRGVVRSLRAQAEPDALISRKAWIYRKDHPLSDEPPYLGWDQALAMPERTVEMRRLDAIRFQNAWSRIQIIRNAELVGPQNPTRRPFIYTTPEVQFRNKLTPLLDTDSRIDVAAIPTGVPQSRALSAQLTTLFQTFFKGSPAQEQLVKLEISYAYRLAADAAAPVIEMPVLLYPPAVFDIPPDWQTFAVTATSEPIPAAVYIETVAEEIKSWFRGILPSTVEGVFRFDLSAFSSLNNNNQPLVRVRNLVLAAVMISDLNA